MILIQVPLLMLSLSLSLIFPMLKHPLSMGITLLFLVLISALILGVMSTNLWLSYILVLILLGGLLVIFIYVSLLSANEMFFNNKNVTYKILMLVIILCFLGLSTTAMEGDFNSDSFFNTSDTLVEGLEWLSSLYGAELSFLTVFLILYLLLTLIVVVVITKTDRSSLRSQT